MRLPLRTVVTPNSYTIDLDSYRPMTSTWDIQGSDKSWGNHYLHQILNGVSSRVWSWNSRAQHQTQRQVTPYTPACSHFYRVTITRHTVYPLVPPSICAEACRAKVLALAGETYTLWAGFTWGSGRPPGDGVEELCCHSVGGRRFWGTCTWCDPQISAADRAPPRKLS